MYFDVLIVEMSLFYPLVLKKWQKNKNQTKKHAIWSGCAHHCPASKLFREGSNEKWCFSTSPNLESSCGGEKQVICNRSNVEECGAANATRPCCFAWKRVLEGRKKTRRRGRGMSRRKNPHGGCWGIACTKHSRRYGARRTVWAPLFLFPILFYPISPFEDGRIFLLLPDIKVNNVACRHNFPSNTIKCAVNLWWSSISSYQGNITRICRPSL